MTQVRITVRARADLEEIGESTEERWGVASRVSYLQRFELALERLAANPLLGRLREALPGGVRALPVGRHMVVYRLQDRENILVIRILHQSMDYPEHL